MFAIPATRVRRVRGRRQSTARRDRFRRPAAAEPATIRAFFLAPLIRELETNGVDVDGFLRPYGLSKAQLTSLYERVPLRHFVAIAEHASSRLDRPFLGLELGKNFSFPDLGPFYAILILSRDVRSAVERLARYESAWQTNTTLDVIPGKDTSTCRYLIQDATIWPRRQDAELALASVTTFIRQLTSTCWRPLAVGFEHDVKGRLNSLKQFFKAPVRGNEQLNSLVISNDDLDQRLRWRFDPVEGDITPILERHLMELLGPPGGEGEQTVAVRAGNLIAKRLGRTSVAIDMVAAEMNTSVRSLRRHLTDEGTSFRQMLQEHRRAMIEAVLRSDSARLSDLANRLGYSDSAVLSRAFKAWTGVSPRAYRKSLKS
jgi:AraC-like DNA-binding protein